MSNTFDLIDNSLVYVDGTYVLQIGQADNAASGQVTDLLIVNGLTGSTGSNLQLNNLQTLNVAGNTFREIRLDLNEGGGQNTDITLTGFKIYDANDNELYSLSHSVLMDGSLSSGSSDGDVLMYVDDSVFTGLSGTDEIYFYGQFANADAGYEEFYVKNAVALTNNFFTVDGTVFEDINGDGDNEADADPGFDGITINLRLDDGDGVFETTDDLVISTTTTDINGAYSYTNVLPGDYWVEQVPLAGFVQTPLGNDNYQSVNQVNSTNINFGNFQLGSISGQKFEDLDGDGVKDAGEAGLENWTIFIDANDNGSLDAGEVSTTTDGNGNYSFTGLTAGSYTIREVQQTGWVQTTADPSAINITSGKNETNVNFGNQLQQTDLQITKEFTPTFKNQVKIVNPGETATFTLTATNAGLVNAQYVLIEDNVDASLINLALTLPENWIDLDNYDPDQDGTLDGIDADGDGNIDFIGDGDANTIEVLIPELLSGKSETVTVTGQVSNSDVVELDLYGQLDSDNSRLSEYANVAFSGKQFLDLNFTKEVGSSIVKFNYNDITNTANISGFNLNDSDNSNNSSTDRLKVSRVQITGELGNEAQFTSFANSIDGQNSQFEIDVDWGSSSGGGSGNHSEFLDPNTVGQNEISLWWDNKAALATPTPSGVTWQDFLNMSADGDLTDASDEQAILDYMIDRIKMADASADKFVPNQSVLSINNGQETQSITVANAQTTIGLGEIDVFIVVTNSGVFYADEFGTPSGAAIVGTNDLQAALETLPAMSDLTGLKVFIDPNVTSTRLEDFGLNVIFENNYLLKELEILGSEMTFTALNQSASLNLSMVNVIADPSADIIYTGDNAGDVITGSSLAETVTGNNGGDAIAGGNGNDTLFGGNGQDQLRGDGGDDLLIGGKSSDVLRGSYGYDVLIGGDYDPVTDTITNDGVADTYVLEEYALVDTVRGYESGKDKIGLLGINQADLTLTSVNGGADTMISLNTKDLMLVEGINNVNDLVFVTL